MSLGPTSWPQILIDAVVHAVNKDYPGMAEDFIKLGFLAKGVTACNYIECPCLVSELCWVAKELQQAGLPGQRWVGRARVTA